ncbi:transposase [Zymomonas mobilis]|uniref:transposase n=1 Tax=Zymomonas mobilis TaxID=542 RepID=UPI0039EB6C0D
MFSKGKRPPFHPALVFMTLVIQNLSDLYDERTEYLINDGLSFTRFLDLKPSDRGLASKRSACFRVIWR